MRKKSVALAALIVTGGLSLAACGGGDDSDSGSMGGMSGMADTSSSATSSSSPSGTSNASNFNDADVTFATDMIPHHRQAVEMAQMAESRAQSPQVKDLAAKIKAAQDPEIQTMRSWLQAWGKPVPGDHSGMDMSGSMPGMMSMKDMDAMKDMSGAEFDKMFLQMMIKHHQGAIEMARTEQASGSNPDAMALAEQIEAAQTAEITTMEGLLK